MATATSVRFSDETKSRLASLARYECKSEGSLIRELIDFAMNERIRQYEEKEAFYAEAAIIAWRMKKHGDRLPLESIL